MDPSRRGSSRAARRWAALAPAALAVLLAVACAAGPPAPTVAPTGGAAPPTAGSAGSGVPGTTEPASSSDAASVAASGRTSVAPAAHEQRGGSAAVAHYVAPEVFADLAALRAASDLVARGRALGGDRVEITGVLVDPLGVDPAAVRLRLIELPADAPALLSDPPLTPGQEYVLFLRSFWGTGSPRFASGDRTMRPVGGPQGQWAVRDGAVVQPADGPLKSWSGKPLDAFVGAVLGAPDLRALAAARLRSHGWAPGRPDAVRLQAVPARAAVDRDPELRAWLDASRAAGLDLGTHLGQPALWLRTRSTRAGSPRRSWSRTAGSSAGGSGSGRSGESSDSTSASRRCPLPPA